MIRQAATSDCPAVTAVVLSYNRPEMLRHALASIASQTYPGLEVLIVDNPSPASHTVRELAASTGARLVAPDVNLGFAGGMNLGIAEAPGDLVLITEDDVVLEPDCVATLVARHQALDVEAIHSAIMLNSTEGTIRSAGGSVALERVFRVDINGAGSADLGKYQEPFAIDYTPGAFMFASSALWRSLEGFRPEYFMYLEDVELCVRARRLGIRLEVVPAARIHHFEPPEAPASPVLEFHKYKNLFSLYLLHASATVLPEFFFRYVGLEFVKLAWGQRRHVGPLSRAVLWTLAKAPSLLRDRASFARRARKHAVSAVAEDRL